MRIKWLLLLVSVIMVVAILFYSNPGILDLTNNTENGQLQEDIQSLKENKSFEKQSGKLKRIKELDAGYSKEIKPIAAVYDTDPVVDAHLIIKKYKICFNQLSSNKRSLDHVRRFKQRLDKRQQQFYENIQAYCQQINKKHPEYSLTDIAILQNQKNNAIASSFWGRIINGEIDVSSLSDYDIKNLLKQNDVNILSEAPIYLRDYYLKVIHWELEDILQNHQYDYINLTRHYAHQLYVCDLGADCGVNSTIMSNLCFINSRSCGLDYPTYISNILTLGQQADIKLTMSYLQNKYQ
ncbi:MAG: hypothetical protein JKY19_02390 [Alcanivoracaceae bacterium]|nr:hypothetical protein [Alcanivoracaceae bacterium]